MPYTPPAQRSPVASQSNTPPRKLSSTVQTATESHHDGSSSHESRPRLPRSNSSQSYLHKHRRSPSLSKQTVALAEQATSEKNALNAHPSSAKEPFPSLTSPPRSQQSNRKIAGADSPPSAQSSSDEGNNTRGRNRKVNDLEELHAAIRGIEQNRHGSPAPPEERKSNEMARDFSKPYLEASAEINGQQPSPSSYGPLSDGARKISHSRSSTDTNAYFDFPKHNIDSPQRSGSDDDLDEDDLEIKPSLIRKKSGELVRPALKGRRRPSSMPGTPTYSKAVHFQDHSLEHVRTFLHVDRPIAVSAGSSPVEVHEDEEDFPFNEADGTKSPTYDWEIRLNNFPRDSPLRQAYPVRTEKIYLSPDTRTLCGNVAVRNLSFHKVVIARFTLDYWKTTSEVVADYDKDVRNRTQATDGYDRFKFEIKLEAHTNLEMKTMFFCVRYQVAGQEYWDNNNNMNYQVDFVKNHKSVMGKQGVQSAANQSLGSLSRNKPFQPRPRSMPSFDDFGSHAAPFDFSSFPQPNAMVGDSPIRLKNKPAGKEVIPDAPMAKPKNPANQQAFGNRYDFGASLSAAKGSVPKIASPQPKTLTGKPSPPTFGGPNVSKVGGPPSASLSKPTALASGKPAMQSPSYHELLDKYCFFGSGKTSAPQPQRGLSELKAQPTQTDGTDGSLTPASEATSTPIKDSGSASPSPAQSPPRSPEIKPSYFANKLPSQRTSRSSSPATGSTMTSRSHSPGFGYPYHQGIQGNFFDTPAPTAIQG